MNELQVKTINLVPAVVEFNFDELAAVLDENLKKYTGLTFTDKDAAACKKVIAELNKGKKLLSAYRIETKKELTVSVTDFENQCKELDAKFNAVIGPLKEQADDFEADRMDAKRKKVNDLISALIVKEGLNDKYMAQLIIKDEYLTKSKTLKAIGEELATTAEHLGIKQDKEEADIEIIKGFVELANTKSGLNLIESTYINLLDFEPVDEIKMRINYDVEGQLKKATPVQIIPMPKGHDIVIPTPVSKTDDESFVEKYEVTGTESQLDALEEYMSNHGLIWVEIVDA
ncbi:DUF1351 domain-containing protein [Sporosarcina sp. FSL K6-5500]|uniref:DUF1351 domain-containing protein n=1 Tax=Sporosarcina sp. FSL K6-5500 TaxID=2921558 RepID=UPI0030F8FDFA